MLDEPPKIVDNPGPSDVLFEKNWSHGGSTFVRELVRGLAADYDYTTRARKKELCADVVHEIRRIGGRFLKQNENGDENTWGGSVG